MKNFFFKLRYWEFWPSTLIYAPTFFLWIFFAFRFRTFTFYKAANPAIRNGGLYGDSKFEIYKLLPPQFYPKTIRVEPPQKFEVDTMLKNAELEFPLIVKPDVGLRGKGVSLVKSLDELNSYITKQRKAILIQEYIDMPNEIGLFYTRLPGEATGKITGITIKELLKVTGDNQSTLLQLLLKNPRFSFHIETLQQSINLEEVLPEGEERCLVPFGNHSRGATFYNGQKYWSKSLEVSINNLLASIDGLYYARLDIRFTSWEKLAQGEEFSIIEVNGAKSEPTHIYDPSWSFWRAQKEIFTHQWLMGKIIKAAIHNKRNGSMVHLG